MSILIKLKVIDNYEQLFNNGISSQIEPDSADIQRLDSGEKYLCALDTSGCIQCWGRGTENVPSNSYIDVSAGEGYGCGITDQNAVECWTTLDYPTDRQIDDYSDDLELHKISAGPVFTCGLTRDGQLHCRGEFWREPLEPRTLK